MTLGDLVAVSAGNLWRMKLRALLTTSGVIIAIAAFVALLSFGAGNRQLVAQQFEELGLFHTMNVYPPRAGETGAGDRRALDRDGIEALSRIPGVNLAYPFDEFAVTAAIADTVVSAGAQALPSSAFETRLFSQLVAGRRFAGDRTREALVTEELLDLLGIVDPDSILGRPLRVSVRVASLDSALARVFRDGAERAWRRLTGVRLDSLPDRAYRSELARIGREELGLAAGRFLDGLTSARAEVTDTLSVCGVLKRRGGHRLRLEPIIIAAETARRFSSGFISDDPARLLAALQNGGLLLGTGGEDSRSYPRATLDLTPQASHQAVGDSVEALGFRAFSFAKEFDEIRKFFLFFNLGLTMLGLIALVTAALGIVNTMMMSISERRREIGVLRALGADESVIRRLFLVESGVIGTAGAVAGIILGWVVSRVGSIVARLVMERQDVEPIELFATPPWLVLTALLFGVLVSLAAGSYPAARAARVDPVAALRHE